MPFIEVILDEYNCIPKVSTKVGKLAFILVERERCDHGGSHEQTERKRAGYEGWVT